MILQDQVTSLDLSKRLKELGMKQESLFYWIDIFPCFNDEVRVETQDSMEAHLEHCGLSELAKGLAKDKCYSAFTASELGEMLPEGYFTAPFLKGKKHNWWCGFIVEDGCAIQQEKIPYQTTEANARALMLVYLLENKLIKL